MSMAIVFSLTPTTPFHIVVFPYLESDEILYDEHVFLDGLPQLLNDINEDYNLECAMFVGTTDYIDGVVERVKDKVNIPIFTEKQYGMGEI